jgi:hypothetical protein
LIIKRLLGKIVAAIQGFTLRSGHFDRMDCRDNCPV